jgi:rubrerythrin
MTMTYERLLEIEARAALATEGPWDGVISSWSVRTLRGGLDDLICDMSCADAGPTGETPGPQTTANQEFIAHARTDVPELLAEVRRLGGLLHWSQGEHDATRALAAAERAELEGEIYGLRQEKKDATDARSRVDAREHRIAELERELAKAPTLWTCPECSFGYDSIHTMQGTAREYECPVCSLNSVKVERDESSKLADRAERELAEAYARGGPPIIEERDALRDQLAEVTRERDEARASLLERDLEMVVQRLGNASGQTTFRRFEVVAAQLAAARKHGDECSAALERVTRERDEARSEVRTLERSGGNQRVIADADHAALAEVTAQAAVIREALGEVIPQIHGLPEHHAWCAVATSALAPDAGRALLAEVTGLRTLRDRMIDMIEASLAEPPRASMRPEMRLICDALEALGYEMPQKREPA